MTGSSDQTPLPRADVGRTTGGAFGLADAWPRGLSAVLWLLLLYLLVGLTNFDEEWPSLGALKPRFFLGALLLLAVVVRILVAAARARRGPAPPDAVTTWWGAFAVAALLSTLWAFDFAVSFDRLLDATFPALFCFPLIVALVRTRRQFLVVVMLFCLANGLYLARSFTEFFSGRHVYTMGVVRMVGVGQSHADPNSFAATVAFTLPLVLWTTLYTRSWLVRAGGAAYGMLAVWAIVLTRSRGGLVLLLLTVFWFLAALPGRKAKVWGVVVLAVLLAGVSTQISESAWHRYTGILTGGSTASERESTHGRIEGLKVAWGIFQERPVLGVGPGCWAAYRMRKVDGMTMNPHNLPGQLLATVGLVGTVTFAGYLLASFLRAGRERRARKGLADPWERAVRSFAGAMAFTLLLHLVAGLAAHNLERWSWFWAPGLLVAAVTCVPAEPRRGRGV